MAKRTMAMAWAALAAAAMVGLGCASSDPSGSGEIAEAPVRIPDVQRAKDAAPGEPITVASLSTGAVLEPGFDGVGSAAPIAAPVASAASASQAIAREEGALPAAILSHLAGDVLAHPGSLELTGDEPRGGVPISMTSDTSLLGSEFDFPEPSLAPSPPAAWSRRIPWTRRSGSRRRRSRCRPHRRRARRASRAAAGPSVRPAAPAPGRRRTAAAPAPVRSTS